MEGKGDHAGVVLTRDQLAPEAAPKAMLMIVEFIEPTTSERFRAEAISDKCYTGRRSWITEDL